jgi:hypothetical protein
MLFKSVAILLWILTFYIVVQNQTITNCDRFQSCSATTLSGGGGTNVDYSYYQCGGFCCGGGFSACLNGGSGTCPKYGCESRCNGIAPNYTSFTHTYFDCQDALHIDTTSCSGCPKPSPTPTPTPTPTPVPCYPCVGDPEYSSFSYDMCFPDYHWSCKQCKCIRNSPVLIDVAGNGFVLTSGPNGVLFDFNNEGLEQTSWTAAGSDDAFLVLDRNGNGTIDDGTELFGNRTPQPVSNNANGFLALAEYDKRVNGGNGDGVIDNRDNVFAALRLWQDFNHDGYSQSAELHHLIEFGIANIDLAFKQARRRDGHGNEFRYRSKVGGDNVARYAWDVFFTYW